MMVISRTLSVTIQSLMRTFISSETRKPELYKAFIIKDSLGGMFSQSSFTSALVKTEDLFREYLVLFTFISLKALSNIVIKAMLVDSNGSEVKIAFFNADLATRIEEDRIPFSFKNIR